MSYPPIYVINLKRTPERKLHIQRQLDALNLRYQFVDAIDKYDLCSQAYREAIAHQLDIDKQRMDSLYKVMGLDNIACMLSHIKIYNLMIKNNIPQACILEDDCLLLSTFPKILVDTQVFLRDVIMFSNQSTYVQRRLRKFNPYFGRRIFLKNLLKLMLYKKYYPQLRLDIAYPMFLSVIQYIFLSCLNLKRLWHNRYMEYYSCKIGAIPSPNKSSRHRLISNHYIVEPLVHRTYNVTSGMGYMLTRSAAIKWKYAATSMCIPIDCIQGDLYLRGDSDLLIISPPCVIASNKYLYHSVREK